jgi:hypothetical protein
MPRRYQPAALPDGSANPRYKKRARPSGPSGKRLSKFSRGAFVAWDGEGVTGADGVHRYVMLLTSAGDRLVNPNGIPTYDALSMLADIGARERGAIHVAFASGYDVNMILRDCSRRQLERLWSGEWTMVCNGAFVVQYRPRKSFSVRRWGMKRSTVLWDTFGFFQSSFVSAVEQYLGKDWPALALIAKQKALRSTFTLGDVDAVSLYCRAECDTLVSLMGRLHGYMQDAGLSVSRWDGAGAVAAAVLSREGAADHLTRAIPREVQIAARHAYAGGRSELVQYGYAPDTPVYHYDINSAYPTAMQHLPSLNAGQWRRSSGFIRDAPTLTVYRVRWDLAHAALYPFFFRSHDASIFYPQRGEGWYWAPEVDAAREAIRSGALRGRCTVLDAWSWEPVDPDARPFGFIASLYAQRQQWKRDKIGAEKVLKLGINSLYGKTAQHVGGRDGAPPRYHQLEYAGWITSYTRAALFRAAIPTLARRSAIMLSTDAVYSLEPLTDLPTGPNLGEWSAEPHDGICVVQSGVYWTRNDGEWKAFSRGFDKGSISVESIRDAWKRGRDSYGATLSRFVTMGSALQAREDAPGFKAWRTWRTTPRALALCPAHTKRVDDARTRPSHAARGMVTTHAAVPASYMMGQTASAPYPLPWEVGDARYGTLDGVPTNIVEAEAYDSNA